MGWIRKRFTNWYIKRGYTFGYKWVTNDEGIMVAEAYFVCPWWVRPLLIFFSPSTYVAEVIRPAAWAGLREGLGLTSKDGS